MLTSFNYNIIAICVIFFIGFWCLIRSRNMVRMVIGIEIMARAATFAFIYFGYLSGSTAVAQALVITVIVVEVAVSAIALAIIMNIFKVTGSLDVRLLNRLKG